MLSQFALARGDLDSGADQRADLDPAALLQSHGGRVVFAKFPGQFLVDDSKAGISLSVREVAAGADSWLEAIPSTSLFYMGQDGSGVRWVVLSVSELERSEGRPPAAGGDREWRELTSFAHALKDPVESLVATQASALLAWHQTARFCNACGGLLQTAAAGWTRHCPSCGATSYPRTDPAIIVAVVDHRDRLLLVHNTAWSGNRMSLLAGYVDAGESAERTVVREVREEVGIAVANLTYMGSQPWPKPRSLMLVYRAEATGEPTVRPDGVEIDRARFFSREELLLAVSEGEVALPGPSAVANSVIHSWLEGRL